MATVLLRGEGLSVEYPASGTQPRGTQALQDVSFELAKGEALAVVGESGSGKTSIALALLGLLPRGTRLAGSLELGTERFPLHDLRALSRWRGGRIGAVFQDPSATLDPLMPVGKQIEDGLLARGTRRRQRAETVERLLSEVGLDRALLKAYPHELSGGERQRVMIAAALAAEPTVLIADEPTTALDLLAKAQITRLFRQLRNERGIGVILISHDLDLGLSCSDRALVLLEGRVVEAAPSSTLGADPTHPYTRALLAAGPGVGPGPRRSERALANELLARGWHQGCAFVRRCPIALATCEEGAFPLVAGPFGSGHELRCPLTAARPDLPEVGAGIR